MKWFIKVLKKCTDFSTRARRKEYWMFALFCFIIFLILLAIDVFLLNYSIEEEEMGLLTGIFSFLILIPSIAVSVRRLHDVGKSGWWLLVSLIPIIGTIVMLYFSVLDSQPFENEWGQSPKYQEEETN